MAKEKAAVRVENPLMPDERLRQMYTAMVQMRMLEEYLGTKGAGVRGEEAVRASTALSLGKGDLISDCASGPAMDLLLGAKLGALKRLKTAKAEVRSTGEEMALRLVLPEDAGERMDAAMGAAAALKAQGAGRVLLVYVEAGAVKKRQWKRSLGQAGRMELPVVFAVLPERDGEHSKEMGELAGRARGWGVPGFPVDGVDAIALYRLMQESLVRARADGGPALIECIRFVFKGQNGAETTDPVERLGELLMAKGVANEAWMERTRAAFGRRLGVR